MGLEGDTTKHCTLARKQEKRASKGPMLPTDEYGPSTDVSPRHRGNQVRRRALYAVAAVTTCGVLVGVCLPSTDRTSLKEQSPIMHVLKNEQKHQRQGQQASRVLSEAAETRPAAAIQQDADIPGNGNTFQRESSARRCLRSDFHAPSIFLSEESLHESALGARDDGFGNRLLMGAFGALSENMDDTPKSETRIPLAEPRPAGVLRVIDEDIASLADTPPKMEFEHRQDKSSENAENEVDPASDERNDSEQVIGDFCSPLEVVGVEHCPEIEGNQLLEMLQLKRDILQQVVEILSDPASAGINGKASEPLLLIQKLGLDEADASFGAFERKYRGHATDSAGWSPEPGGFNRWLNGYYTHVLKKSRPVVIAVHGGEVCALENELSLDARRKRAAIAAQLDTSKEGENHEHPREPGIGENFDVPVVLLTLGWDPAGDPTHGERGFGRDNSCALRVADIPRVLRWFTSHTRHDSRRHEKFRYLPIGFGGWEMRNGLPHTAYLDAAKSQLRIIDECPFDQSGRYDLLFQCNTLHRDPRGQIWNDMTNKSSGPIPVNYAPLEADRMVVSTAQGIFGVSPPGTGEDCFRHYEMILLGSIVMVGASFSLESFMGGLPVFYFGEEEAWGSLTCERLVEMFKIIRARVDDGKNGGTGLELEKVTHGYWRNYVRRETLIAAGLSPDASYAERSTSPLNRPGWKTYREVGCYHRKTTGHGSVPGTRQFTLRDHERSISGCAARCAWKTGGGVGFFGIKHGDLCWCDKDPGIPLDAEQCDMFCEGDRYERGACGGDAASMVYAFGPEKGLPFEYLGCFRDKDRIMYHAELRLWESNTPYTCEAFCTSLRLPFFALEAGSTCRCGVLPSDTARSVRTPEYEKSFKDRPPNAPPNASMAAKPNPENVHVGDTRFVCHEGRCSGDSAMWGCGSKTAFDLYKVIDPCLLFREC